MHAQNFQPNVEEYSRHFEIELSTPGSLKIHASNCKAVTNIRIIKERLSSPPIIKEFSIDENDEILVDITDLNIGNYVCLIHTEEGTAIKKFSKQ